MATEVVAVTGLVVSATVAEFRPSGIRTLGGIETMAGSALVSDTNAPPLGADWLRTTLAVEGFPPMRRSGRSATQDTLTGSVAAAEALSTCAAGLPENPPLEDPACALFPQPGSNHRLAASSRSDHEARF
jgi:hypothetical protein